MITFNSHHEKSLNFCETLFSVLSITMIVKYTRIHDLNHYSYISYEQQINTTTSHQFFGRTRGIKSIVFNELAHRSLRSVIRITNHPFSRHIRSFTFYSAWYWSKSVQFGQSAQLGSELDIYQWGWSGVKIQLCPNLGEGALSGQKLKNYSFF